MAKTVRAVLSVEEKRQRVAELRASGGLASMAAEVQPVALAAEQLLAVPAPLDQVLPEGGLRRGTVAGVEGEAAMSLGWSLAGEVTRSGTWVAVVGVPDAGWLAAHELGVDLARCLVVAVDDERHWPDAVAALVGAVDLIMARTPVGVRDRDLRRVAARCRERGTTLLTLPGGADGTALGVERRLVGADPQWVGLTPGRGRLAARRMTVSLGGRRGGGRRAVEVWLPGPEGRLAPVEPTITTSQRPALRRVG